MEKKNENNRKGKVERGRENKLVQREIKKGENAEKARKIGPVHLSKTRHKPVVQHTK